MTLQPYRKTARRYEWITRCRSFFGICISVQIVLLIGLFTFLFGIRAAEFMFSGHGGSSAGENTNQIVPLENPESLKSLENFTQPSETENLEQLLKLNTPGSSIEIFPHEIPNSNPFSAGTISSTAPKEQKPVKQNPVPESVAREPVVQQPPKPEISQEQIRRELEARKREEERSREYLAESLLQEARMLLPGNPVQAVLLTLHAVETFETIEKPVPETAESTLKHAMPFLREETSERLAGIVCTAYGSDGRWMLISNSKNEIRLVDLNDKADRGEKQHLLGLSSRKIVHLALSPDNRWIIGGAEDGTIVIWKFEEKSSTLNGVVLAEKVPNLKNLQISPDGKWLAAYGYSPEFCEANSAAHAVWLWNIRDLGNSIPQAVQLRGHTRPIRSMAISENSRWLLTGSEDRTARLYDLGSEYPAAQQTILRGHDREITSVAFGPNSAWVATGSRDNSVRIWKIGESKEAYPLILNNNAGWVIGLALSPDGKWLATAGFDRSIRLWPCDYFSAPPIILPKGGETIGQIAFSPDGKYVIVGERDGLRLWDVEAELSGMRREPQFIAAKTGPVRNFECSPDGRWLTLEEHQLGNVSSQESTIRLMPLQIRENIDFARTYARQSTSPEQVKEAENFVRQLENLLLQSYHPGSEVRNR